VRGRQAVGSAGELEVGRVNVNAGTGGYLLSLPIVQPRLAAYSTRLPLSFSGAGTAGRYLLDATADGYQPRQDAIDLASSSFTWNVTLSRQ